MKLKTLVVVGLISLFASSAFAQWFPGRVNVSVYPAQVAFQVYNPHNYPIVCNGQVFGQTIYNHIFTNGFYNQVIYPGGFRWAYVNAFPYAPFATGWANIQCQFYRW